MTKMCLLPEAMDPQLTDPILRLAKIPTGKRPVRQDVEGSVAKASLLWERHTLVRLFPRADRDSPFHTRCKHPGLQEPGNY